MDKPFVDQIKESIPSVDDITNSAKGFSENISNSYDNTKNSIQQGLQGFSDTKSLSSASSEFLNSNSVLAKFSFLILVLVAFLLLMKVGISLLGRFLQPTSNPVLFNGVLDGNSTHTIDQDPKKGNVVQLSNNQSGGIEYTWSIWVFINRTEATKSVQNIFVKGDAKFHPTTKYNLLNGPGLYLGLSAELYTLDVQVDTMDGTETVKVSNIPVQKWFHVAIRLKNKTVDTYINGVVTQRLELASVPKQNFNSVTLHGDGGYSGKSSNLTYYASALSVFEINNIIMRGPNMMTSNLSVDSKAASGNYSYLSSQWYTAHY